jgi:exonuclease III
LEKTATREHRGVGLMIHKTLKPIIINITPINGRIIVLELNTIPKSQIISIYAPQSGLSIDCKQEFYNQLSDIIAKYPNKHPTFILGDFNARIGRIIEGEQYTIGPYYFDQSKPERPMHTNTQENREVFMDFATAHNLTVSNTWFEKPITALQTYRHIEEYTLGSTPDSNTIYEQIDYCLVSQRWKNSINIYIAYQKTT